MNADSVTLRLLQDRLRELLPPEYQDSYELMAPVSMGSAPLQLDTDGLVAWDRIWGSFCDLAMAGGPPHKGALLEPADRPTVAASRERHADVAREICRGIGMVTGLHAVPVPDEGWVRVRCESEAMAQWLMRAITMENVAVRVDGAAIDLPAAPSYRLEKEIKNVVTVVAKICHYWSGHMSRDQRRRIADLFALMDREWPLISSSYERLSRGHDSRWAIGPGDRLQALTGLTTSGRSCHGWLGLNTNSVRAAVWMMRLLMAMNVVSRREDQVLFVPVNPVIDHTGDRIVDAVQRVFQWARARGVA